MSKSTTRNESLLSLEKSLKSQLGPVDPDKGFISELRQELERSSLWNKQERTALSMLTIAAGLLLGTIIFLLGRFFLHEHSES